MLLRVKYRFGTPAWFLTPWADQELQHQSQGPVVIYTGTLGTRWEKTASTKKKMVKGGAQGQQAGKSSNLSFYQQIKKKRKEKKKEKKNNKRSTRNSTNFSGETPRLPPTQRWEEKQVSISPVCSQVAQCTLPKLSHRCEQC